MTTIILIAAALVALLLTYVIMREPIYGVYAYLVGSAVLLTANLPVVREKLAACDFIMLMVLASYFVNPSKWQVKGLLPIQATALRFAGIYVAICGLSIAANVAHIEKLTRPLVEYAVYVYGFVACIAIVVLVDTQAKWRNCLIAWCFGTGIVGIFATLAATGLYDPGWGRDEFTMRISSTLRESGQISSYCGPILPFLVFASSINTVPPSIRRILYVLIVPVIIAILGSGSRIAFLILIASLGGVFLMRPLFPTRSQLGNLAFWIIAVAAFAGLSRTVYHVATDTSQVYAAGQTSPFERPIRIFAEWWRGDRGLDTTRQQQAERFYSRFFNHPLFGIGLGNYSPHYRSHEIHNSFLSALAETGVVGFTALLLWLASIWRCATVGLRYTRDLDYRLLIACVMFGFLLLLMYQVTTLGLRQRPWWFIPALMICIPRILVANGMVTSLDKSLQNAR